MRSIWLRCLHFTPCVSLPRGPKKMQEVALETAINSIRVRFGSQALTRAAELPPPQPWPSGTPVDRLTGISGLPRGRLSLLTGNGTCGKLTLALALLARATHEFAHATVIDGGGFDAWTLLPFSPELGALTIVGAPAPEVAGRADHTTSSISHPASQKCLPRSWRWRHTRLLRSDRSPRAREKA